MARVTENATERIVIWRQLALGLALFGVYLVVNALPTAGGRMAADDHALDIDAFEGYLQLDFERPLNAWLEPHEVLSVIANYEYAYSYIISALALLVWLYVRRKDLFTWARDTFIALNLIAMSVFALYPVTPPRLLPELGYVDTVSRDGTWGSWGSGLVDSANQLAAMPSLHVGWALWVSVILARITASRWVQTLSGLHVVVTFLVIVATANHFVLDAVGAIILVVIAVPLATVVDDHVRRPGALVPPNDAFFLHVESRTSAQHVGGLVVFEPGDGRSPSTEEMRTVVTDELGHLPRFRQRLARPARWRRPRWVDAGELDWAWHVNERHSRDGVRGLRRIVAELAESPLPRDRPMWRIVLVRDVAPGQSALLFLMHHCIADGIGTVSHALALMRPAFELPGSTATDMSRLLSGGATIAGLAQLATDGGAKGDLGNGSSARSYATADLDLDGVRRIARERGCHVTDLMLALIGDAVRTTHRDLARRVHGTLSVSVPLMVRGPDSSVEGNATAAVTVHVPLDDRSFSALLTTVERRTSRLRTPTRVTASRFVMASGLRLLPEPCVRWFARTVYGGRFFHAIASNMPGPTLQLSMGGAPITEVYPILPLAPRAPIALGALSWNGRFGVGLATDPTMVDADLVLDRMQTVVARLTTGGEPIDEGASLHHRHPPS